MQLAAPEVVDFSGEPEHVQELYGIGEKETDDFGRQLLLARRLAEQGVRFIQICHAGGGNGAWDAHGDIKTPRPALPGTDKPIAGLIRDLKQRGMLDADAGRLDQRVRPQPLVAEHDRPRSQPAGLHRLAGRRRRQGRDRPRRHRRRRLQGGRGPATTTATCTPRSSISSASTTRRWSTISSGEPCALVEEGGGPIKEILA